MTENKSNISPEVEKEAEAAPAIKPKSGKEARVDFSQDEKRIKRASPSSPGAAGIKLTDKKEMVLPNGIKVEN